MSIQRRHENAIVVTPATLKNQIVTRINTLVNKAGGEYYFYDSEGFTKSVVEIEGMEIHGVETKGREVYLLGVSSESDSITDNEYTPYNVKEFFIEQLWEIYLACEPIYQLKFNDYATTQE
jgi:hypothetical protein